MDIHGSYGIVCEVVVKGQELVCFFTVCLLQLCMATGKGWFWNYFESRYVDVLSGVSLKSILEEDPVGRAVFLCSFSHSGNNTFSQFSVFHQDFFHSSISLYIYICQPIVCLSLLQVFGIFWHILTPDKPACRWPSAPGLDVNERTGHQHFSPLWLGWVVRLLADNYPFFGNLKTSRIHHHKSPSHGVSLKYLKMGDPQNHRCQY